MLSRSEAKQKIADYIRQHQPIKTGEKLPIKLGETFPVYRIPIEYLVPNVLNDRIAWRIREFEAENNRKLSVENQVDVDYVYKLIEEEHVNENDKTLRDIALKGQQQHGVITNDGIIIDGNRRATLIRLLFNGKAKEFNKNVEEFRYFETIVLADDVTPEEIMALETSLQIGEDIKVKYNAINIYIKIDNLIKAGYNVAQISQYMGEEESIIKQKISTFELMNVYLDAIGKPDHFTLLDGLEDQFIKTNAMFKKLDNKTYSANWNYTDVDVNNFKEVAFDYIRNKYEGKEYRDVLLGGTTKADGVFSDEKIWKDFYKNHEEIINNAVLENESDWKLLTRQLEGNLKRSYRLLTPILDDKNISSTIDTIASKVNGLEELIREKKELNETDIENIKNIEKRLYNIRKEFE